jgi:hypothetical protein
MDSLQVLARTMVGEMEGEVRATGTAESEQGDKAKKHREMAKMNKRIKDSIRVPIG